MRLILKIIDGLQKYRKHIFINYLHIFKPYFHEFRGPANKGNRFIRNCDSSESELDDVEERVAAFEKSVMSKPRSGHAPDWLPDHAERYRVSQTYSARNQDELDLKVGETVYETFA